MVQTSILDMRQEMTRRKGKRDDLLDAFEREGQLYTREVFAVAGTGASSRIKELKRKGHRIASRYISPGNWLYVYLGNQNDEED